MAGRFSLEAIFKATDRFTAPVKKMQSRVGKFTRSAERRFRKLSRVTDKFAKNLKRGLAAGAASLLLMGSAMANITNAGADFGRAIGSAAVKFPGDIARGTEEFKKLEVAAREVGATTEFTAVQAAQGLNFLAKAGFDAEFSMRALKDIVDFATASEIEFAAAADIASDAIGAFGLDSSDTDTKMAGLRRIMDVLSLTANSTNTNVAELFETVKKGAPVATAAGSSLETYAATMGVLAQSGIKASDAGNSAKNITLSLAGIGNKAAKTFKNLGIKVADSNGQLRDQFDIMDDLRKKLSTLTQKDRLAAINDIFGKRALASVAVLLNDTTGQARTLRKALEAAQGSTTKTAEFIRNDVRGSIDSLKSAVEGVKISIFSMNEGPLKDTIDKTTLWVRENEALIALKVGAFILHIINNLQKYIRWMKTAAKVIAVFFIFNQVLKIITGTMVLFNLVMAANPIVLLTIAIVAVAAALTVALLWLGKFVAKFAQLPSPVIAAVAIIMGPIGMVIGAAALIAKHWEPIKGFFRALWDGIKTMFTRGWEVIKGIVDKIVGAVKTVTDLRGLLTPEQTIRNAGQMIGGIPEAIGNAPGVGFARMAANPQMREAFGDIFKQMVSPQERVARTIEENRSTSSAEVTIRDESGRAEVTSGELGNGLNIERTGGL